MKIGSDIIKSPIFLSVWILNCWSCCFFILKCNKKGETLLDYIGYLFQYLLSCCLENEWFSKLFSKKSHLGNKKNSPICVIRSLPDAQRKRNKNITAFIDEDCSYEKDYAECTESENSSEAASLVPQDIFYDPSEEEYDYDNSLHTTSSNLRAQRMLPSKT